MRNVSAIYFLLALVFFAFVAGAATTRNGNTALSTTTSRKLIKAQDDGIDPSGSKVDSHVGLDDYGPVDPPPISRRVPPKPIQHGTPMMPYIPNPPPPPPHG